MGLLKTAIAVLLLQTLTPPPAQPQQPQRTASIEGSVVGPSGERLSKVTLTLAIISNAAQPGPPLEFLLDLPTDQPRLIRTFQEGFAASVQSVVSDTDGRFLFENLRPGSYRLDAARSGYVSTMYGQKGANGREMPIVITAGQKVKDIQIAMLPAGGISGRIVDRNGEPISRATVQALKYLYTERGRTLFVVQSVTTNDLGEYRLFWLAPGSYIVRVMPTSPQVIRLNPDGTMAGASLGSDVTSRTLGDGTVAEESPAIIYYPGTEAAQEAASVAVRAAETVSGVNMTALPARVHKIRGVTLNGAGTPESMSIALVSRSSASSSISNSMSTGSIRSNSNGTFEIAGVTSGSYFLMCVLGPADTLHDLPNLPTSTGIGVIEVEVGNSDVSNVRLTAASGFTLKGRIITEGMPQRVVSPNTERLINLAPLVSQMPMSFAMISPDGTFVFQSVFPGDYQVTSPGVLDGSNGFIKSVRLSGQEVLTDGLHIRNQPEGELTVVVSMATGKLQGRILNGRREPATNATIVIAPEPSLRHRTNLFLTPKPDASGKFSINVPPGRYMVFAWEDVEPGAWFDADFMQNYESRGQSVTIGEGNTESVEINLIPYMP